MKNNNELPKMGTKGTVAGLVLCFVAMITLVGAYSFGQYQDNVQNEIVKNEIAKNDQLEDMELEQPEIIIAPAEEANTSNIVNENTSNKIIEEPDVLDEVVKETRTTNEPIVNQVSFSEGGTLMWPISGGVILKYSMEESVYFETLNQYKRNPAMIIDGEVGTEVLAAERGIVASVDTFSETGNTVTLDMGNGYTAIYGQLEDIKVSEGNLVEKGQIMGVLAEPSKYYSVEGCNLYFQMLKDGEPIDPLEYLE